MTRQLIAVCLCCLATSTLGCGGEEPEPTVPRNTPGIPLKPDDPGGALAAEHLSPSNDSMVEACIRATACDVKPYPRISNCTGYYNDMLAPLGLTPVYDQIYRCTNGAKTCAEVKACFGATGPCDSTYSARCDNGRAVFCDLLEKTTFAYDCAGAGLSCELDAQYGFAATCTGQATPGTLTDTLECKGSVCQRTGQPCQADAFDRCEGGKLQSCLDGEWVSFDCLALGLGGCRPEDGGWARCGAK